MKAIMMKIIFVVTALALAYPYMTEARGESLRESLINKDVIKALYAVDETHSFVVGKPVVSAGNNYRVVKWYSSGEGSAKRAYLIEHSPEPLIYKNPVVPAFTRVAGISDGPIKLKDENFDRSAKGYTGIDAFQLAYAACSKKGGTLTFVIPKRYGKFKRLTSVDAIEAFDHILLKGKAGAWYIACEGESRFRILKNYSFLTGNFEVAEVRNGIGLNGVNYAKDEAKEKIRIASLDRKPLDEAAFLEVTAREIAFLKMGFVKPNGNEKYYGTYKSTAGPLGCDSVSIKRSANELDGRLISRVYDYSVCRGEVAMVGERDIDEGPAATKSVYASSGEVTMVLR
ncbi:MAG: hypothetical protein BMS9Abin23_0407 [Thermodesulfobacteriota bacterium]|nr:MAG: hypothetical protein BMS9Abin23_0407 [Thermodesulfobacteriota bacterium]